MGDDSERLPLVEAVAGDLRTALEAIRDHVAAEMDAGVRCKACGGGVASPTAALSKQLTDVLLKLKALPSKEASPVDAVRADRARRRAQVSDAPAAGRQRRPRSGAASGKRGSAP